jgi:hypothetical protein
MQEYDNVLISALPPHICKDFEDFGITFETASNGRINGVRVGGFKFEYNMMPNTHDKKLSMSFDLDNMTDEMLLLIVTNPSIVGNIDKSVNLQLSENFRKYIVASKQKYHTYDRWYPSLNEFYKLFTNIIHKEADKDTLKKHKRIRFFVDIESPIWTPRG